MPNTLSSTEIFVTQELQLAAKTLLSEVPTPPSRFSFSLSIEGKTHPLAASLNQVLSGVLQTMANGGALRIERLPEELTSTVAAKMLGISRPTLMKMVASGDIPSYKVGSHTRVLTKDVLKLSEEKLQQQIHAFAELQKIMKDLEESE
ncbi:MAG: helix-turn-helix domain-containing protein [Microbacteriaceae bacterium]